RSNLNYNFGNITPDEARVRYEEAEKLKIEKDKQIATRKTEPKPSAPSEEKNESTE
ncbi:MAG: hypothetical protein IH795_13120, partial [Bacteroidetes bacterium]|nr:hypothetical protein [Bacteroidota bacterium]